MRIRSIHPEFWRSEDVAALDWDTRLVFIGLWSYVDDNGVGRDVERLIIADLFPLEEDPLGTLATVSRGLRTLSDGGQITRYTVGDKPYLHITAWDKWQRIDKPGKARYEPPTCTNAVIRDSLATVSRDADDTPAPGEGEKGRRGEGEKRNPSSDRSDQTPPRFDEFWDTYDHKLGRRKAESAYRAALRKPGVTDVLILSAAASYIEWQRAEGKHPQFTKHPATWLNGEHWTDERVARQQPMTRMQEHLSLVQQLASEEADQPRQIGPTR